MKKTIKLAIFNTAFIILAILCFSHRGLGLNYNPNDGPLKFALSVSLSIFGIAIFFFANYIILTATERIGYKIDKLTTIDECIFALTKCKKTDPAFVGEIDSTINQLNILKRRKESLTILLEQNGVSESFNYLNDTANKANFFVFSNVKSIINRLIVFDNEEYDSNKQNYDISPHRIYIRNKLHDNENILKEYSSFLIAVSSINDIHHTNIDEIKDMTAALNHVLKGKQYADLEKKYSETQNNIYLNKEDFS